jgi:hypothetical protein
MKINFTIIFSLFFMAYVQANIFELYGDIKKILKKNKTDHKEHKKFNPLVKIILIKFLIKFLKNDI